MSTLCEVCSVVFAEGSADLYDSGLDYEYWTPFDIDVVREVRWHPLHTSRKSYEEGLAYGCELCSCVTSIIPADSSDLRTCFLFVAGTKKGLWIIDSSLPHQTPRGKNAIYLEIVSMCDSPNIAGIHGSAIAARKSPHTGSSEALHLAFLWLKECTSRHERCARLTKPTWYPTRLLQVTDQTVRLIDTAEKDLRGPYFTLSHRWGFVPPKLMLTPQSAESLRNGLDIFTLEHTFRDALVATRSLGVQLIWIDLFCIFQGPSDESQQDWAKESATMDRIYSGSFLNISAACTHDGSAGCFTRTSTLVERPSLVRCWARYCGDEPSYYELTESHPYMARDEITDFYLRSPVFNRGWIVQERILAPRVLHFADRGMTWECYEGVGTQSRPHIRDRPAITTPFPLPGALAFSENSRSTLIHCWNNAFNSYTQCKLTIPNKDKLIALQGISKRIAGLLQDTLFFGFLSCRMPYSLCWISGDPLNMESGPENCAFPSWHFARSNKALSILNNVCGGDKSYAGFEMPLLCYFHSPDLDPSLSMVPKYLCCIARTVSLVTEVVHGRSLPLTLTRRLDDIAEDSVRKIVGLPRSDASEPFQGFGVTSETSESLQGFDITFDHDHQKSEYDERACMTLTLMPVFTTGRPMADDRYCEGLVLQQTANGDHVRKGVFTCYSAYGLSPISNLGVLLEALEAATPRFIMIA
jgi:hypothetical protein